MIEEIKQMKHQLNEKMASLCDQIMPELNDVDLDHSAKMVLALCKAVQRINSTHYTVSLPSYSDIGVILENIPDERVYAIDLKDILGDGISSMRLDEIFRLLNERGLIRLYPPGSITRCIFQESKGDNNG